MATAGSIVIDLLARTGSFETDMDRAARTARRTGREMAQSAKQAGTSWKQAAAMMGTFLTGLKLVSGFNAFIQNTIKAQNEQAQLAAVLNSTGRAASMNVGELNKMAAAMERATTFSSTDVTQAQTTLLAFTGIAGKEFPRAMQAAADMAARTGMTIKAAAETIGRALDVPSQGLSALSRQGFRFTDAQKELAKQLEATGRTAEAQAMIFDALEESYGGAASAARDTLGGALTALGNTLSNLLTAQNGGLDLLRSTIEGVNDALSSDAARTGMNALILGAEVLAVVVGTRLAVGALTAAGSLLQVAASAVRARLAVAQLAGAIAGSSTAATAGMAALSVAARAASAALALVGGPVGAVVLALSGAAWAWSQYGKNARDSASEGMDGLDATKLSVDELTASFQSLTEAQIALRRQKVEEKLAEVQAKAIDAASALRGMERDYAALAQMFRDGRGVDAQGLANVERELIKARAEFDDANQAVQRATEALAKFDEAARIAAGGVAPLVDEIDRYRVAYEKFMKDFATPDERFKDALKQQREALGPLFNDDALKRIRDRYLPKPAKAQASELENLTKRLEEQRATLGMNAEAAERWRIEHAKGTETHRKRALALFDEIQTWKDAEEATRQAAESMRTFAAIEHEIDLYRQGREVEIAGIGLSDRQRELMAQEIDIRQQYAERRRQLEEAQQVESTRLAESAYRDRISALRSAEDQQVQILLESAQRKQDAEQSWLAGLMRGLGNYADSAKNAVASVERSVASAFGGMADAMTTFVTKGKMDFKTLADSIISDMMRIVIQQSITGPLARSFGGMFGFSGGGYTGDGGRFEPAGIVHKGEGVLSQPEVHAIGGEAGFNALRRAIRGPGHAVGGMAGLPIPPPAPAARQPQITVNVQGAQGQPEVSALQDQHGNLSIDLIWKQFRSKMGGEIQSGQGPVPRAFERRYGLTPQLG